MAPDGTSQAEPIVEVGCGVGEAADIEEAGREAARVALAGLRRFPPSAVLVFGPARRDAEALLRGVRSITGEAPVLGATAAGHGRRGGQIHDGEYPDAPVVAAIGSPVLSVRVGVGEGVSRHWRRALHQALSSEQLGPLFDGTGVKEYGSTPLVLGDAARLGQVFLNLLVNAAQAIPEGAADRNQIRVVTSTDASGHALTEIHDTGTGTPPQDLERVFEPFYTTRQARGANGLGLSISRNLVAAMGGSVTVESRPKVGSCFRLRLPPAAAAEVPASAAPAAGG